MKTIRLFNLAVLIFTCTLIKSAVIINKSLVASSGSHLLSIAIPDDYDAGKKYPLVIGLHYCGGNSAEYRNALIPFTDSLKMIVVCPDNSSSYIGDDKTDLITISIDSAIKMYNIDTTSVYLTGMSCNGEVVLKEGMKKLYPFRGIFPWAPYMSTVESDAIDFNSNMPVTIAIGTYDQYSFKIVLDLYDSLKTHNANVNLVLVPGISHTLNFPDFANEMIHSLYYLNDSGHISITALDTLNYEIMDTAATKEIKFKVYHLFSKELSVNSISSNIGTISDPEIIYTPEDSVVKLRFKPIVGKSGRIELLLEVKEKDGISIKQMVARVNVTKAIVDEVSGLNTNPDFAVYPNPANDKIYIRCSEQNLKIQIIDATGRFILSARSGSNDPIDITKLNKGLYLIKAEGREAYPICKFIIE
jgi:dienelactone hydrolase